MYAYVCNMCVYIRQTTQISNQYDSWYSWYIHSSEGKDNFAQRDKKQNKTEKPAEETLTPFMTWIQELSLQSNILVPDQTEFQRAMTVWFMLALSNQKSTQVKNQ